MRTLYKAGMVSLETLSSKPWMGTCFKDEVEILLAIARPILVLAIFVAFKLRFGYSKISSSRAFGS